MVVTLNDEPYMELEFNFDEPSVQVTRTYDFTLPSTPGNDGENSSQNEESSSNEEPSSEQWNTFFEAMENLLRNDREFPSGEGW